MDDKLECTVDTRISRVGLLGADHKYYVIRERLKKSCIVRLEFWDRRIGVGYDKDVTDMLVVASQGLSSGEV